MLQPFPLSNLCKWFVQPCVHDCHILLVPFQSYYMPSFTPQVCRPKNMSKINKVFTPIPLNKVNNMTNEIKIIKKIKYNVNNQTCIGWSNNHCSNNFLFINFAFCFTCFLCLKVDNLSTLKLARVFLLTVSLTWFSYENFHLKIIVQFMQQTIAIVKALLTLDLKIFKIFHWFFKDPKSFSIIILSNSYNYHISFYLQHLNIVTLFFANKYVWSKQNQ